ncbi:MAG: 16S rRNA (guanine(966)-N(2))-methyltransferase RsmD [Lachnospiraceae bacterium]|nr:16S rRNA (guanine(966)-N(2))-methyltransferase RsmD [Lachnospiraceae bacterium]
MRVVAGTARSLPLKTVEGMDTRPTTDRIKETLFNMINFELPGSIFVDLYSGSGSIGIEALSRGASKSYFVENNRNALCCVQENLSFTRLDKKAIVIKQDVLAALRNIPETEVDFIFMDPPYNYEHEKHVLTILKDMSYVTEDTMIIVEASLDTDLSYAVDLGFVIIKEKRYKTNKHVFLKKA